MCTCRCGFATYLLSILIFIFNVRNGAYFLFLTGAMLCLAPFTYGIVIQNDPPFKIPFQDGVLIPTFDYSFYLTAATGGVTILLSIIIVIMDIFWPRKIATFFHHSLVDDDSVFEVILLLNSPIWENFLLSIFISAFPYHAFTVVKSLHSYYSSIVKLVATYVNGNFGRLVLFLDNTDSKDV